MMPMLRSCSHILSWIDCTSRSWSRAYKKSDEGVFGYERHRMSSMRPGALGRAMGMSFDR